jgi:hypothetical protein
MKWKEFESMAEVMVLAFARLFARSLAPDAVYPGTAAKVPLERT